MRASAVSLVTRLDGSVLAVWNKKHHGWVLPGGKVKPHEIPEDAQRRELREETSLETIGAALVYDAPSSRDPTRRVYVYLTWVRGIPRQMEEGCVVIWMPSLEDLRLGAPPSFERFYRDLEQHLERRSHASTCDVWNFDPEKQLGPDEPCSCKEDHASVSNSDHPRVSTMGSDEEGEASTSSEAGVASSRVLDGNGDYPDPCASDPPSDGPRSLRLLKIEEDYAVGPDPDETRSLGFRAVLRGARFETSEEARRDAVEAIRILDQEISDREDAPEGALDALQIVQRDRDVWKRKALEIERECRDAEVELEAFRSAFRKVVEAARAVLDPMARPGPSGFSDEEIVLREAIDAFQEGLGNKKIVSLKEAEALMSIRVELGRRGLLLGDDADTPTMLKRALDHLSASAAQRRSVET